VQHRSEPGTLSRRAFLYLAGGGALLVTGGITGCGGGSKGGDTTNRSVEIVVEWPARSRYLPYYAQSITAQIFVVGTIQTVPPVASLTRNRTRDSVYTETLTFAEVIPDATYDFVAKAWSGADGTGEVVATAGALIQTFPQRRTPLYLAQMLSSEIKALNLPNLPVVMRQGETIALTVEPRGSDNRLLMLPPGAVTWSLASGDFAAADITPDGVLTVHAPGRVRVQIREAGEVLVGHAAEIAVTTDPPPVAYRVVHLADVHQVFGITQNGEVLGLRGENTEKRLILLRDPPNGVETEVVRDSNIHDDVALGDTGYVVYSISRMSPDGTPPVLWKNGSTTPLQQTIAVGVDQVVGVDGAGRAVLRGADTFVVENGQFTEIPGFWGTSVSAGGAILGNRASPEPGVGAPNYLIPLLWENGTLSELETTGRAVPHVPRAATMQANGVLRTVGSTGENMQSHHDAVRWDGTRLTLLSPLSAYSVRTAAKDVNTTGHIVGWSQITPSLAPPLNALALGDSRAVLWKDDAVKPTDLNTLIPRDSGWVLESALAINDAGHIVGYGTYQGTTHQAFLLIPL
jgi:hypothetical protein